MAARRPRDSNQLAKLIVDLSTGEVQEGQEVPQSPKAKAGRLGGIKGGKARAATLSKAKRREIAKKAAAARWKRR
jgi:hypothetical protein